MPPINYELVTGIRYFAFTLYTIHIPIKLPIYGYLIYIDIFHSRPNVYMQIAYGHSSTYFYSNLILLHIKAKIFHC